MPFNFPEFDSNSINENQIVNALAAPNCTPPYCGLGSKAGWCNCNCECCPPSPCWVEWNYVFGCGTKSTDWTGADPNNGCVCPTTSFGPKINTKIDFENYVFAFAGSVPCEIPCDTVTIKLKTTGCCLYGSGLSFIAIGAGTISFSQTGNNPCFFEIVPSINGQGNNVTVNSCDPVTITYTVPNEDCCTCCLIDSYGVDLTSGSAFRRGITGTRRFQAMKRSPQFYKQNILQRLKRSK